MWLQGPCETCYCRPSLGRGEGNPTFSSEGLEFTTQVLYHFLKKERLQIGTPSHTVRPNIFSKDFYVWARQHSQNAIKLTWATQRGARGGGGFMLLYRVERLHLIECVNLFPEKLFPHFKRQVFSPTITLNRALISYTPNECG